MDGGGPDEYIHVVLSFGVDFQGSCEAFYQHIYLHAFTGFISIIAPPLPLRLLPWLLLLKRSSLGLFFLKGCFSVRYNLNLKQIIDTLAKKSNYSPRSRDLYRNNHHLFPMPIEQVQVDNHPFQCHLSSLRSICCYPCLGCSVFHYICK